MNADRFYLNFESNHPLVLWEIQLFFEIKNLS